MKKRLGHYCHVCGRRHANEKFSGKGHTRHICKECHRDQRAKLRARRREKSMCDPQSSDGAAAFPEASASPRWTLSARLAEDWLASHAEMRETVEKWFSGGFTRRDEANALVAMAFRNGPIEDLHAGEASELLDRPELSRITDDEMKAMMLSACRCLERLLHEREEDPDGYFSKIFDANNNYCRRWER